MSLGSRQPPDPGHPPPSLRAIVARRLSVQPVRRPLRHLLAYGSTNKYRPVKNIRASTATAVRPSLLVYFPRTTAMPLTMTTTVKAMDSQRWVCRTHLFQFNPTSSELVVAQFDPVEPLPGNSR